MTHLDKVARFNTSILPGAIDTLRAKETYLEAAIDQLEKNEQVSIALDDIALRTYYSIKESVSSLKLLLVVHGKQIDNVGKEAMRAVAQWEMWFKVANYICEEGMLKFVSVNFPHKHKRLRKRLKRYRSRLHAAKSVTDQLRLALETKYSISELANLYTVLLNFSINAARLLT